MSSRTRATWLLIVIVLIGCAGARLWQAADRALIPFQVDYAEGTILAVAVNALHGGPLYTAPGSFPYVLNPYGPVTYCIVALLLKVFGLSLFWPRCIILASAVGISVLIGLIAKALGGRSDVGALFGVVFFCNPIVWIWLPLLRVDFLAVLFSLTGLLLFARRPTRVELAAICFVAAGFTKQSAVAAPIALCVELLLERRLGDCLRLVVWLIGLSAVALTLLGRDAAFHLISIHQDPFSPSRYVDTLMTVLAGSFALVLAATYGAVLGATTRGRLAWVYLGVCTLTTLSAGKMGAETNHFIEWLAAVASVAAISLSVQMSKDDTGARLVAAGVLAVTLAAVVGVRWFPRKDIDPGGCRAAYDFIARSPSQRILSEDVTALLLGGKPVAVSDPFAYSLIKGVTWERGGLEHLVSIGYFDLVVVGRDSFRRDHPQPRWSPELVSAVTAKYRAVDRFQCSSALGIAYVKDEAR
jgi:hypothetical protein